MALKRVHVAVFPIIFTLLLELINSSQFIEFKKPKAGIKLEPLELIGVNDPLQWVGGWPMDKKTVMIRSRLIKYSFDCGLEKPLNEKNKLKKMKFCAKPYKCGEGPGRISLNNDLDLLLTFDANNGGKATLQNGQSDWIPANVDLSMTFHCEAESVNGIVVRSNTIEIIDMRRKIPSGINTVTTVQQLVKGKPLVLPCLQNTIESKFGVREMYDWHACNGKGEESKLMDCSDQKSLYGHLSDMGTKGWHIQTLKNGSLLIPYVTKNIADKFNQKDLRLYCKFNSQDSMFYSRKIDFQDTSGEVSNPSILHPRNDVNIDLLNSAETKEFLRCNFMVGNGEVTVNWKFNGEPFQKSEQVTLQSDDSTLEFTGPFDSSVEGTYQCTVSWKSRAPMHSGKYNVRVISYPEVSPKMVPKIFVVDGKDGVVECLFSTPSVKPNITINGAHVSLNDETSLKGSVRKINEKFSSIMSELNVIVTPLNPKEGDTLRYTAKEMKYKDPMTNQPASHQMQCIGTLPGVKGTTLKVQKTVTLQVVPKPVFGEKYPRAYQCNGTGCSPGKEHTIHCEIENSKEITSYGVVIEQFWRLHFARIDEAKEGIIFKYFNVSDNQTRLTVGKVENRKDMEAINQYGTVSCVVKFLYPKYMKWPADRVFMDSTDDNTLNQLLTVPLKLTLEDDIAAAGLMWVIPVSLAVIVILIVITLLTICLKRRKVGETYNVDEKEKQQGHDPEAENEAKENFPMFERPDDGPIQGRRMSLDESIGIASDDDASDLAEYDEQGSFVGKYNKDGVTNS